MSGDPTRRRRRLTIPNAICVLRILAAPVLVVLAAQDRRADLVILFVAMAASDWVDGKLAILLDQRSDIGPRLDSMADATMYTALLIAVLLLEGDRLLAEWAWLVAAIGSYLVAGGLSLMKFGRWPNHHTRVAKMSWGVMLLGAIAFVWGWSVWPLRVALAGASIANAQSMLITRRLREWRADVSSPAAARRSRVDLH